MRVKDITYELNNQLFFMDKYANLSNVNNRWFDTIHLMESDESIEDEARLPMR